MQRKFLANFRKTDVHHCSKFFQSDARATETLKIESPDQPGWSLSIYNLFERLSWQMALFSLWWTTPSTDPLLTDRNIPPSFYQLYMFRASKSVLLALPRLKVLLMYSLWREIQGISTKFWHYFPKFDFVLLKEPFATLKKSRPVVHAWLHWKRSKIEVCIALNLCFEKIHFWVLLVKFDPSSETQLF